MSKFLYLGRQPVLDTTGEVNSYLLRFTGGSLTNKLGHLNYTASISKLLHSFQIVNTLDGQQAWVQIDCKTLIEADVTLLPKESFTLYLMKVERPLSKVFVEIEVLMDKGYRFVIDASLASKFLKEKNIIYLKFFDAIIFDGRKATSYAAIVAKFQKNNITCAIRNILSKDLYTQYEKEGFSLFLGAYFKEAKPIKGHQISSSKRVLLEILTMLKSDAEIEDIISAIKVSPDVSLQLLRYINSASVQTTKQIESIKETTMLLGRQKLMSWIVLSLFTAKDEKISQALIDTAMMRAHLMELLCELLKLPALKDQAFLVGLLSVSDAIFKVYLHVIIDSGNFSKKVSNALLEDKGDLAKLLKIAKIIEEGNQKKFEAVSLKLNVSVEEFSLMLNKIYLYVKEMRESLGLK